MLGALIRSTEDQGKQILIVPMLMPDQALKAEIGGSFSVEKIHRVIFQGGGKPEKKQLGGGDEVGRITYFPPHSGHVESLEYLVLEGLEDALTLRATFHGHHILVCQSKSNLQHVPEFLPQGATVLIIADHDGHANQNENGEVAAAKLRQQLRELGFSCLASMPKNPKEDANDAIQRNALQAWADSRVEVPEIDADQVLPETDFDIDAIVGDALPEIPRGILPQELETYLELVAEQFDLNYEAAFCELLVNISIAIGGRKQIHVHQSDHGWKEKACLWLASLGLARPPSIRNVVGHCWPTSNATGRTSLKRRSRTGNAWKTRNLPNLPASVGLPTP